MRRIQTWFSLLVIAAVAFSSAFGDEKPAGAAAEAVDPQVNLFDDPVVAKGKGVEIKRGQVDDAFIALKANLAVRGQSIPEQLRPFREAQLLDRLIVNQLMINRATDTDKKRGKEIGEKLLNESKGEFASEEVFYRRLKALGMSVEQFHKRVQEQALADAVLEREVKSRIAITDAQVKEFYETGTDLLVKVMEAEVAKMATDPDTKIGQLAEAKKQIEEVRKANLVRLQQPEKVRVVHVLLATRDRKTEEELPEDQKKAKRQQIGKLLERARAGENFAKLVQENSEDRGLKETKGEYTFARDDPFVPEFKAAAFSLQTNQISDVVTTIFGYHLIKLLERIPAKKLEFDKAAPEIKEFLLQQEMQKQMPEFFARIKSEASVEILDPKYKVGLPKENEPGKSLN